MLQSFQLFAKTLRTLLAPRSNPQMGSHPHLSNKKDLGKSQSLFYGAGNSLISEPFKELLTEIDSSESKGVIYRINLFKVA